MNKDHSVDEKLTAVEWLELQLLNLVPFNTVEIREDYRNKFEQAKQIEKEQICKAWNDGDYAHFYSKETGKDFENGEEYYNEKYQAIT